MSETADPATVLVVEDDASLNAAVCAALKLAGHRPISARTAAEGLRWYAHYAPDLILLDLGLPDADGLSVIRRVRERSLTPVLVLSARDAEAMKVEALDLGADDYLQKPFGVDELLARIRAGLRHAVQMRGAQPVVMAGDIAVDFARREVTRAGVPVRLSPKEYDLLGELAMNLGRVTPHRTLLLSVWGREGAEIQYLRVYMSQLRRKLGADRIRAEPGVGYRLVAD